MADEQTPTQTGPEKKSAKQPATAVPAGGTRERSVGKAEGFDYAVTNTVTQPDGAVTVDTVQVRVTRAPAPQEG